VIVELNARPGLWAQEANQTPLRKRLERVEGLDVRDAEHGVKIARALFAARFADRVMAKEGLKILETNEIIKLKGLNGQRPSVLAKIDTGACRSSIDVNLAESLDLLVKDNVLWERKYVYKSAAGRQSRPVIGLTLWLGGRKIKTSASVANREKLKCPVLIGRNDLAGFLIKVE